MNGVFIQENSPCWCNLKGFCVAYTKCVATLWHNPIFLIVHESRAPDTWSRKPHMYGLRTYFLLEWWFPQFMGRLKLIIEHSLKCNLNSSFSLDRSLQIEKSKNYLKYLSVTMFRKKRHFINVELIYIYFFSSPWFLRPNQPRYQFMAITSTGSTGTQIPSKRASKTDGSSRQTIKGNITQAKSLKVVSWDVQTGKSAYSPYYTRNKQSIIISRNYNRFKTTWNIKTQLSTYSVY